MIYYLSVVLLAGITDILFFITPHYQTFKTLLEYSSPVGCEFECANQEESKGLAEAFTIGKKFMGKKKVALILGDNLFYGYGLGKLLRSKTDIERAAFFAYPVKDPERYGVVELDEKDIAISIEDKPTGPKSKYTIPGLFIYDIKAEEFTKRAAPTVRGEKKITSISLLNLKARKLEVGVMTTEMNWFATGTVEALDIDIEFSWVLQNRKRTMIICNEKIVDVRRYIDKETLYKFLSKYGKSNYAANLNEIANIY